MTVNFSQQYKLAFARKICSLRRAIKRINLRHRIRRIDNRPVMVNNKEEIRAFIVARNESLRLPFLLQYYSTLGVDRIFVLDNGSSDDTVSIALSYENTHVFSTDDHFANKSYWLDYLLRCYGYGNWCLIVDADEIFIYPYYERLTLRELCDFHDQTSTDAVGSVLLDMFPNRALGHVKYQRGDNPLLIAPWFDTDLSEGPSGPYYKSDHVMVHDGPGPLTGGMRKRVFGVEPCLSKFPLVKFKKSIFLSTGTHYIEGANVSDIRGISLHFKYLHDFPENARREAQRGEYYNNSIEYVRYASTLDLNPDLTFHTAASRKLEGSDQLLVLGLMRTSDSWTRLARSQKNSTCAFGPSPEPVRDTG